MQRKFSKYIPGLFNVFYLERLIILDIETLEDRQVKYLLLIVHLYKIANKLVEIDHEFFLSYNSMPARGHNFNTNI